MTTFADQLLVLVMLINLLILGTSRLIFSIRAVATQRVILSILPELIHPFSDHLAGITANIILTKRIIIPYLINDAIRKTQIKREIEPFIDYVSTLLLSAVFTTLSFTFTEKLPLTPEHKDLLFIPTSIATLLTGFLLLTTRRKAISQIIDYLILENNIFIFDLLLTETIPVIIKTNALLDLLIKIFIIRIIINHISREFSSIDTSRLRTLKEE